MAVPAFAATGPEGFEPLPEQPGDEAWTFIDGLKGQKGQLLVPEQPCAIQADIWD